ncbi:relaxase/mobilization nuclease domain-containing protein [Puia dinghuensis]|uniref:MobA/VirD2-like nuclease domain-containing protein n=1 Tax=Puia dinghuensis TaxID=1792502 RepID=A0A8J2U9S5_9BACT|nr:relaxase/mobilization nuclease domain-containing protein [Puia dinghuensis]GGA89163.1 hypothetical protein GCM10011511_10490 [Puia dinghuensis]
MIARIFPFTASFGRVCQYLCQDEERSEVLQVEGVRGHHYALMAMDFEAIHALRPGRSRPVFHGVLDFHPEEKVDNERMVEIARKYLEELKLVNTQYAFVKHIDRRHEHLHIVANRLDYDGNPIETFPIKLNSKDAVEKLVAEYGLLEAGKKNLRQTNWDALDQSETRLYIVYSRIKECLPGCQSLEELEQRLLQQGVDTRYRIDEETGRKIGISFRYQQEAFKGSRVDEDFSLPRLEETIAQQQRLALWQHEKLALRDKQAAEKQLAQEKAKREELAQRERQQKELAQKEKQREELGLHQQVRLDQEVTKHHYRLRIH